MTATSKNAAIASKIPTDGDAVKPVDLMSNDEEAKAIMLFLSDPRFKNK